MCCWLLLVQNFQVFEVIPLRLLCLSSGRLSFNLDGSIFVFLHLVGYTALFRRFGWLWRVELLDVAFSIRRLHWRLLVRSKLPQVEILDYVGCNRQNEMRR